MCRVILVLVAAFTVIINLSACQSQMVVPDGALPENFSAQTISIKPMMTMVKEPYVQTPGGAWGAGIGGLIGESIAAGATTEEQYSAFLKRSKIDLKKIVTQSFRQQLSSAESPLTLLPDKGDIEIMLAISFYGINPAGAFSDKVEPMLEVEVNVFVNNGQHILTISESIKFPDDDWVEAQVMEDYMERPELLVNSYTRISDKIAETLIQQLATLGSH